MKFKIPDTPEELFRQGNDGLNKLSKYFPFFAFIFVILFTVLTSFYQIEPNEVGIIKRFGKYIRTTSPGLHWKLPLGIESLNKVPVEMNIKNEFGFRTERGGVKTQYSADSYEDESLMLTGDLNFLNVLWIVQYKISDPKHFLFEVKEPIRAVRDLSESIMRQVVGDNTLSEVLNTRRVKISLEVQEKLQETLNFYKTGILIETVELKDVNVPRSVKPSFNKVNQAEQKKEEIRNQAQKGYNKVIFKARGEAEKTIEESEGYATMRINEAKGDAVKFISTWEAYKEAKDVTKKRLYLEYFQRVMSNIGKTYIMEPDGNNIIPLLNLTEGKI